MFLLLHWMCFQFFRFGNSSRWWNNRENYCNENYESVFSFIHRMTMQTKLFEMKWQKCLFRFSLGCSFFDKKKTMHWIIFRLRSEFSEFIFNFKRIITHCSQWLTNKHVIHSVSIDYIVLFIQLTCTVHYSLCTNVNHPMLQRYFNKMCN